MVPRPGGQVQPDDPEAPGPVRRRRVGLGVVRGAEQRPRPDLPHTPCGHLFLTFAPPPDFAVKKDKPPSKAAADHIIFEEQGMMFSARNVFARVSIGIAAAGIGATALFPLDLVKTRMMNQRIGIDGQRIYKHSVDCKSLKP